MIKFLKRIPWKDVLVTVLVVALGVGAVVGVGAAITNKQKTVSPLVFERGAIDENGQYVKSTQSIYTKDYIECQGLEITPDFEATGTYQVFYYDVNRIFIGATPVMDASNSVTYKKGVDFPYAKYACIVITPEPTKNDYGYVDEDFKIKFYQVTGVAGDFTIKVNKKQSTVGSENLLVVDESKAGKICHYDSDTRAFLEKDSLSGNTYSLINVKDMRSLRIVYEEESMNYSYCFYDANNKCVLYSEFVSGQTVINLNVPEGAVKFGIIYSPQRIPAVYRAS